MPTTIFTLPREIRDQIYAYLWDSSCLIQGRSRLINFAAIYPSGRFEVRSSPRWLYTNKQILEEGQAAFHLKGHVNIEIRDLQHSIPHQFDLSDMLLSPYGARDLRFVLYTDISDRCISLSREILGTVKDIFDGAGSKGDLRELEISVHLRAESNMYERLDFSDLFAAIALVGNMLRKFKLRITYTRRWERNQPIVARDLFGQVKELDEVVLDGMVMQGREDVEEARQMFGAGVIVEWAIVWTRE
jgi:hypothetical protein